MSAYRNILVPVDGSPTAGRGLRKALRLAQKHRAKLVLVHVVDERPAFLKRAQVLAGRSGIRARARLRRTFGEPAGDEIVAEAKRQGSDLIVMGSHRRGRNAARVLRSSSVPVLVVRRRS